MKPGIKTSEFGLTATAVAASIANSLGLWPAQTEVGHAVNGLSLTLIAVILGAQYIGSRLKLKIEPDVRQHIVDAAIEKVRPLVESEIAKRLPDESAPTA